jgi:mono/diheme cytochrome c family protein
MKKVIFVLILICIVWANGNLQPQLRVSFQKDVFPIFQDNCAKCHLNGKTRAELSLETYESLVKGGKHGSPISKDKPEESILYIKVSNEDPPFGKQMPFSGEALKPEQIKLIKSWLMQGSKNN